MLWRALLALVVGCLAIVVACTDDATDVVPELHEQQAAVEVEQEVEQNQERSSERRGAAPASEAKADTAQESQTNETPADTSPADSEPSEQAETQTVDTAASQSASSNPTAEISQQSATEEPSDPRTEPEGTESQAQPQQAVAQPEVQSEPEPELDAPAADNDAQEEAEESHVAQPPATDPETDTEEEQTARVAPPPVGSDDNVGGSGAMTEDEPVGREPLDAAPLDGSSQTSVEPVSTANTYTWQDGKYTRTITHQADLTVTASAEGGSEIGPRQAAGAQSDSQPVFQSDTGETMTLPGGVLLVLDVEWDQARIDRFFKDNHVDRGLVQERTFTTNAYFIETEPGFPSLNLANELARQDGVVLSSPNWQTEVELQ